MCGITGVLGLDGTPVDLRMLDRMTAQLTHRGPDEIATLADGPVGLGHARLSIIDVTGGLQPMTASDDTLWLTYNGEIFNYVELRADLIAKGHRFRTTSDTEVLLHLYQEYGPDCVHRMNGQWAFALWDDSKKTLLLSRDRLGVRPLFLAVSNRRLLFASEIKAILASGCLSASIDAPALDQLLTFWTPLSGRTLFEGISEVPPGHSLILSRGTLRQHCYWQPSFSAVEGPDDQTRADHLLELLLDAVRLRLRADVPVGAYLSGGLDSTLVAALARRVSGTPPKTFSIGFEDQDLDESRFQQEAAAHLASDHESLLCRRSDVADLFADVIWHTEKPIVRTAPLPLFLLSRLVRSRGIKVVLTGEGADEMLGGYDIFKEVKIRQFCARAPESTWRPSLLRRLYPYVPALQSQSDGYLRAFFRTSADEMQDPMFSHLPRWRITAHSRLFYSGQLRERLRGHDAVGELRNRLPSEFLHWDSLERAQYLEATILLPGYILSSQGDRMAMAHSVEARYPFLDHRVVDFALSLPSRLKIKVLNEKYLLKRAARGLVPRAIEARSKQPYRGPDADSFFDAHGRPPEYVAEVLSPARIGEAGFFDPAAVAKLLMKMRTSGRASTRDNMAFVAILSTQLLHHLFVRTRRHEHVDYRYPRVHRRELPFRAGRRWVG